MVNHATKNETARIMVALYMAGKINHVMNHETAKITDSVYLACGTMMEREERLRRRKSNIALEGTEKLLKRENQGWKQEEHMRDVSAS